MTIIKNSPRSEYDSLPKELLNYSRFKHFLDSPAHLVAYDKAEREDSPALLFGDALHTLCLEGTGVFHDSFTVLPEGIDRRTKEGKLLYASYQSTGKKLISQEDYDRICNMEVNLRRDELIKPMMQGGSNEVTLVGELYGVKVKARLDRITEGGDIIDLKSMNDIPKRRNFRSTVFSFKYYIQAAYYSLLLEEITGKRPKFYFIAMEKNAPFSVRVFTLDETFMKKGIDEVKKGLTYYKACVKEDFWPAFPPVVSEINYSID
jgi:hypothetical protein